MPSVQIRHPSPILPFHPHMNQCHPLSFVIPPFLKIKEPEGQFRIEEQACHIAVEAGDRDCVRLMFFKTDMNHMPDEKIGNPKPPCMGSCHHIADGADPFFPTVKIGKSHHMI